MTDFYANSVLRVRETDHGDGTGTRTIYDEHGNVTSVEQLTGFPVAPIPARILPADPDLTPPSSSLRSQS